MELFHVHLLTTDVAAAEQQHLAAGFAVLQRTGRIGGEPVSFDESVGWDELEHRGFRLRLVSLGRAGVEVVLQPGRWVAPRVDHLGVLVTPAETKAVLGRAEARGLAVQARGNARTFVSTGAGYRLELRPAELSPPPAQPLHVHLATADPAAAAAAVAVLIGVEARDGAVELGHGVVRFHPGGPESRPALTVQRPGSDLAARLRERHLTRHAS